MSAPAISTSLTADCLVAMRTPYTTLTTACGQQNGPDLTNLAKDTSNIITFACSTACSDALSAFRKAADPTCGDQVYLTRKNIFWNRNDILFLLISCADC